MINELEAPLQDMTSFYCYIPVLPCLVVPYRWDTPSTVGHHLVLHRAVIVEPAQELRGLPIFDRVMDALDHSSLSISPHQVRLKQN